jgi:tetratricopeptide (TPR) repeat protein
MATPTITPTSPRGFVLVTGGSGYIAAHNALGNHYVRLGCYEDALRHFDQVVFSERKQGRTSAVIGWRANVLFNLGDGQAAFREINGLISQVDRHDWIWPWCARLVAAFGRGSVENAGPAARLWQRFIHAHPGHSAATRELLMSTFYLRGQGEDVGKNYSEFRAEFDRHIVHLIADDAALPWDRLGHWAQDEGDWAEAERCFREAYDLEWATTAIACGSHSSSWAGSGRACLCYWSRLTLCSLTP